MEGEEYIRNEVEMAKLVLQERVNEMQTLHDLNEIALKQEAELIKRLEDQVYPRNNIKDELQQLEEVERTVEGLECDIDDIERMIAQMESEANSLI